MTAEHAGQFARAYRAGVTEQLEPSARGARAVPTDAVTPRAAPMRPIALRGAVITPTAAWTDGYVVVDGGIVADVRRAKPDGVRVIDTDGVILPGLIDLHGHPEFNVFAAWEPPRRFSNRYIWRSSDLYHQLVRDPQNELVTRLPSGTQLRYAEVRALVGGVTAIQGASARTAQASAEPLVRNVDLWIFDQHRARSMIDLPSGSSGRGGAQLARVLQGIADGAVDAFYLHLCEGRRDDKRSQTEFQRFLDLDAATPATVVIHGCALSSDQLAVLAAQGCKLVWSPQSNLRLYGQTTLAADALRHGMPVALGADWLPSGSTSLLAEMKVARRVLADQGMSIEAHDLVHMVTAGAAEVAGLGQFLGALTPGRPADVVVFERHHADPYENVCRADPAWVELVLIGGDVAYGRDDWFTRITEASEAPAHELVLAWGQPMRLDTGFQVHPGQPSPSLADLRTALVAAYPQVGPIFA